MFLQRASPRFGIIATEIDGKQGTNLSGAIKATTVTITKAANGFASSANPSTRMSIERKNCAVCVEEKASCDFFVLPRCQHSFCRECYQRYINIAIQDGKVKPIKCMATKCDQKLYRADIVQLVDQKTFAEFDYKLTKKACAGMNDALTCPSCSEQCFNDFSTDELRADKIVQCPYCKKRFCFFCKQIPAAVDGPVTHYCLLTSAQMRQASETYESPSTSDVERERLEQSFGRENLQNWSANKKSELVVKSKKTCPQCRAPSDREQGCNHVTCSKCDTEWCWLCSAIINGVAYEKHYFQRGGGGCYGRVEAETPTSPIDTAFEDDDDGNDDAEADPDYIPNGMRC